MEEMNALIAQQMGEAVARQGSTASEPSRGRQWSGFALMRMSHTAAVLPCSIPRTRTHTGHFPDFPAIPAVFWIFRSLCAM